MFFDISHADFRINDSLGTYASSYYLTLLLSMLHLPELLLQVYFLVHGLNNSLQVIPSLFYNIFGTTASCLLLKLA